MQKILIILLLGCILYSCKKEEVLPDAPSFNAGSKEFGSAKGTKNGDLFECSVYVTKGMNGTFLIALRTEEGKEETRESFSCANVPLKIGTYNRIKSLNWLRN